MANNDQHCPYCEVSVSEEDREAACTDCGDICCPSHRGECGGCTDTLCDTCGEECSNCGEALCSGCQERCETCDSIVCSACVEHPGGGRAVCPDCIDAEPDPDEVVPMESAEEAANAIQGTASAITNTEIDKALDKENGVKTDRRGPCQECREVPEGVKSESGGKCACCAKEPLCGGCLYSVDPSQAGEAWVCAECKERIDSMPKQDDSPDLALEIGQLKALLEDVLHRGRQGNPVLPGSGLFRCIENALAESPVDAKITTCVHNSMTVEVRPLLQKEVYFVVAALDAQDKIIGYVGKTTMSPSPDIFKSIHQATIFASKGGAGIHLVESLNFFKTKPDFVKDGITLVVHRAECCDLGKEDDKETADGSESQD